MKKSRLLGFMLVIFVGMASGLIYGWVVNPVGITNTSLDSLRADYKADYVLMVAEAYAADLDLEQAEQALKNINSSDPVEAVRSGLLTAQQLGYSNLELRYIAELEKGLNGE